ncbi:MAG: appF, partial [Microvirga sp.]|nr:appF [Microvirga sp.]
SPKADPEAPKIRRLLKGDIPSPLAPPSGCVFRTRCPHATGECAQIVPALRAAGEDHRFACLYDIADEGRPAAA